MLAQRVASAVVAVPIILALIALGGWPYALVVAAALGIATAEFQHLRHGWFEWETLLGAGIVAVIAVAAHRGETALGIAAAGGLAATFAVAPRAFGSGGVTSAMRSIFWLAAGTLYLGGLGSAIILLRNEPGGRDWVYLALLATFATDTAAYFIGRAFGRHKLAPRISPKKTWEGFFGGWAGGFAAVLLLNYFLGQRLPAAEILPLATLLPIAATAGDLAESALKRWTGVKDASELIPGHGGVLDRLDSVLFTFALVYLWMQVVG